MSQVYFTNLGEIDPRLITTLGVNVKESDSPIGFFGTGLKYALAVLLRSGQEITIFSGLRELKFQTQSETIRGKSFDFIYLVEDERKTQLAFTTELGKNWTLQHAYRELYCNAKDEGGHATTESTRPEVDKTVILVEGADFYQTHLTRHEFILDPQLVPLPYKSPALEVYNLPSNSLFYRGIAVKNLLKLSTLRYNLLDQQDLTEDRTLAYDFFARISIVSFLTGVMPDTNLLYRILVEDCWERTLDLSQAPHWSPNFTCAVELALRNKPTQVDPRLVQAYYNRTPKNKLPKRAAIVLTSEQEKELTSAKEFLELIGYPASTYKVTVVDFLGDGVLGLAERSTEEIFLASRCFHENLLEETLLEEIIHLYSLVDDETREMQDKLLREIIRVGKLYQKETAR